MKNIVLLVVDAFCYDNLNRKIGAEYTTPFLRELSERCISFSNMYSQAPYTEASLVSILSGLNTLENGGYLFGNKNVDNYGFSMFKNKGYKIISQYSPYVYSKAYLKNVDFYYYTRLVNIHVLFDYRLSYFKEKYSKNSFSENDMKICEILIDEAFNTWISQAEAISSESESCALIKDMANIGEIGNVLYRIKEEYKKYKKCSRGYIERIFEEYDEHILLKLADDYNKRKSLPFSQSLYSKYTSEFKSMQKKYSSIIRKDLPDIKYIFRTLINNNLGFKKFKGLVHNYIRYYTNKNLKNYFSIIDENAKTEACMKKQFDYVLHHIDTLNEQGFPVFAYMHVQDFHLPSVFHSVEFDNFEYIDKEIREAISLFSHIDKNYKGNIISDLSARYCDCKIKELYEALNNRYNDDFILVITADHGYPSFFTPPRPVIYNQTYKEAFHIPYIVCDGNKSLHSDAFASSMDFFNLIENPYDDQYKRKYILSEYGGPGCPAIYEKPIWYTYIDRRFRASAELYLDQEMSYDQLKEVHDLLNDSQELNNIVKSSRNIPQVKVIMEIINDRNKELREQYLRKGSEFIFGN